MDQLKQLKSLLQALVTKINSKAESPDLEETDPESLSYIKGSEEIPRLKHSAVNEVFGILNNIGDLDNVKYMRDSHIDLDLGKIYFFESSGEDYKVQLRHQNGDVFEAAKSGIIVLPVSGNLKYIAIKESPSSIGLSDLLNFKKLFDKFIQSETYNTDTLPPLYLESIDDHKFGCWEIAGNFHRLKLGTYAIENLIEGITAELTVSFVYPVAVDEYAIAIDGVEIDRQSYGGTIRIASELVNATSTEIVFFKNNIEKFRTKLQPTIQNCGILLIIEG